MNYQLNGVPMPRHMREGLDRYIQKGQEPGPFLTAILVNNLRFACDLADLENEKLIPVYLAYLFNEAPEECWGTPAKVGSWLSRDTL